MSVRGVVSGLAGAARDAARHPRRKAGEAVDLTKGALSAGTSVAGSFVERVRRRGAERTADGVTQAADSGASAADSSADLTERAAGTVRRLADATETTSQKARRLGASTASKTKAASATTASKTKTASSKTKAAGAEAASKTKAAGSKAAAKTKSAGSKTATKTKTKQTPPAQREPEVVLAEPAPPAEPPVDVVEQALAAEAQGEPASRATEPHAVTRAEEHGQQAIRPEELEEIDEETAEAFPPGTVSVDTPAGTTGADVGFNPDTAEPGLRHPDAEESALDPAVAKQVRSEAEVMEHASDPTADDKG